MESLIRQNVTVDRLVAHVMKLEAFDSVYEKPPVSLFQDCFQELKAADTIPKVFLILKNYFSFFNYEIIEHIIKKLGTESDMTNLQSYKDMFDQYVNRRVFECRPQFGPVSRTDCSNIILKLDSRYDNYTAAAIKAFLHKLSEVLCVSSQGVLRLCEVEKGCIQLTIQVPLFV